MPKWIQFVEQPALKKVKTKKWHVLASEDSTFLGRVLWFGRWRGYIFEPAACTVFEKTCLRDLASFLETQNRLHREAVAEKKANA